MVAELEELQNPINPPSTNRQKEKTTRDLAMTSDKQSREAFLNNTMKLNNNYAFGSIKCDRAPDEQLGSRKDTCKYNGELCCQLGDIEAPPGRPPLFAQTYTITPEAAMDIREVTVCFFFFYDCFFRIISKDSLDQLNGTFLWNWRRLCVPVIRSRPHLKRPGKNMMRPKKNMGNRLSFLLVI
jgi:hypothetical protein